MQSLLCIVFDAKPVNISIVLKQAKTRNIFYATVRTAGVPAEEGSTSCTPFLKGDACNIALTPLSQKERTLALSCLNPCMYRAVQLTTANLDSGTSLLAD